MISYLLIAFSKPIRLDDLSNLPYLIRLGFVAIALQVEKLFNTRPAVNMMASLRAFRKYEIEKQHTQIREFDVGVRFAAQDSPQQSFVLPHLQ
jgi:hypothetical protein